MRAGALAVALLGAVLALVYMAGARRLGLGVLDEPGPGLYPLLVGVLLVIGAAGTAVEALAHPPGPAGWPEGAAGRRVLVLVAAVLGYAIAMPYAGHPLAGAIVTLVALEVMGLTGWPLKLGLAAAAGLASHYLFAVVLGVPLPRGAWLP